MSGVTGSVGLQTAGRRPEELAGKICQHCHTCTLSQVAWIMYEQSSRLFMFDFRAAVEPLLSVCDGSLQEALVWPGS